MMHQETRSKVSLWFHVHGDAAEVEPPTQQTSVCHSCLSCATDSGLCHQTSASILCERLRFWWGIRQGRAGNGVPERMSQDKGEKRKSDWIWSYVLGISLSAEQTQVARLNVDTARSTRTKHSGADASELRQDERGRSWHQSRRFTGKWCLNSAENRLEMSPPNNKTIEEVQMCSWSLC